MIGPDAINFSKSQVAQAQARVEHQRSITRNIASGADPEYVVLADNLLAILEARYETLANRHEALLTACRGAQSSDLGVYRTAKRVESFC